MDIEYYRRYRNRPTSLMAYRIFYCVPNVFKEAIAAIHQHYGDRSQIKTLEYGGYTYIGVNTGGEKNHGDQRQGTKG